MWLFRGKQDDDSDFDSEDYDSDEYETDEEEEEELDSNDDDDESLVNDDETTSPHSSAKELPPERAETEEDYSDEEEVFEEHGGESEESESEESETGAHSDESSVESGRDENGELNDSKESTEESIDQVEMDDSREEEEDSSDEEDESSSEEEEEEATSMAEKRALLALAAENDRVDILKAILVEKDRDILLSGQEEQEIPPLHVAISYGSTHATSCLLRMGANPAIRPTNTPDKRYAHVSAWELAFDDSRQVKMAPSKREGIRHAFTAEALRCIGSDEVERLQHLLDSGMPIDIDIGGKDLYGWSVEMEATKCQELTKPADASPVQQEEGEPTSNGQDVDGTNATQAHDDDSTTNNKPFAIVSHPDGNSLLSLDNRLEELESLSKALSSCLDNLAEETSVCHGLLLLGGGASALASHVKSLKVLKERQETQLERSIEEWNDSQDELAYWLQQNGGDDGFDLPNKEERKRSFTPPVNDEDEEVQKRQLKAQIAASENKVRKLRASIADLSEENARDLVEVEKRGLSGGIKLVRTLREELREVEYELSEAKSGTAACRARVNLIVSRLDAEKKKAKNSDSSPRNLQHPSSSLNVKTNGTERVSSLFVDDEPRESDRIASGDSEAIALRPANNRAYFDLWEIILRIIGFGRVAVKKSVRDNTPSAMII